MTFAAQSRIGRLRVPAAWETRVAASVRSMDLHPRSLPAHALLIVRKLASALPRDLAYRSLAGASAWQTQLETSLSSLASGAARPIHGPVPAGASAVLFSDRSELLACLARDQLLGELAGRWWWQSLEGNPEAVAEREWAASPQYVPAALEILASERNSVRFAAALAPAVRMQILWSVLKHHGLTALATQLSHSAFEQGAYAQGSPAAAATFIQADLPISLALKTREQAFETGASAIAERAHWQEHHSPPWKPWVAEPDSASLSHEAHAFLWVPLMIRRAPAEVRGTRFADAVGSYFRTLTATAFQTPGPATGFVPNPKTCALILLAPPPAVQNFRPNTTEVPLDRSNGVRQSAGTASPPKARDSRSVSRDSSSEVQQSDSPEHHPTPEQTAAPQELPGPPPAREIVTAFGGAFFLINVAIELGYYADFTNPAKPGLDLTVWDFLALITPRLLRKVIHRDPLWKLLADLASRDPDDAPGAGFIPPDHKPLHIWVSATANKMAHAVKARSHSPQLIDLLIEQPAIVRLTQTHVDVHFSLAEHPFEIRLSGFDRNPGWVPAAARIVTFHFD